MVNNIENELFREMVVHAGVGLVKVDADGVVIYTNPFAQALLGGGGEGLVFEDLFVGGETVSLLNQIAVSGEGVVCYPKAHECSTVPLLVTIDLGRGRAGFVATLKKYQGANEGFDKNMGERTAQLERINSDLNEFAYVVSHDLKAPLRAIFQLSTWIIDDYGHLFDDDGREQMGMLCGRVEQMNRLIDGVLLYSRVGKESKRSIVDMNDLFGELNDVFSTSLKIRMTQVNNFPSLYANKVHLLQLFQNIISNAEKYMITTAGEMGVVTVEYQGGQNYERFIIADNGPGIPKEYHEEIFKMFTTVASHSEDSGVGLAIVKKLMHYYEGRVTVESEPKKGSSFILDFKKNVVQCGINV
ncbi:MAG: HAMP domain-containing histidine kinase [Fibrobacterales bacterium]